MSEDVEFVVPGRVATKGSYRRVGNGQVIGADPREKDFAALVQLAAFEAAQAAGGGILNGPVILELLFTVSRPSSHFRKAGSVKTGAPAIPFVKPDNDKVARSVGDALASILYHRDQQVSNLHVVKRFCGREEAPGMVARVRRDELPYVLLVGKEAEAWIEQQIGARR